jgi:hypothetical protein
MVMDNKEARKVLLEQLARYRTRSYEELLALFKAKQEDTLEVRGPSGTQYQLEFMFFWDNEPGGNIRVWERLTTWVGAPFVLFLKASF